jgi:hypothetical protein
MGRENKRRKIKKNKNNIKIKIRKLELKET